MDLERKYTLSKNPRENAGFFSKFFFLWAFPIMRRGQKKDFDVEDLPKTLHEDQSKTLYDSLEKEWEKELERQNSCDISLSKKYMPSLFKAIARTFGPKLLVFGICTFIEECILRLMQPLAISRVIACYSRSDANISKIDLYLWGGTIILSSMGYVISHHPYFFGVMRIGMQIRVACSAIVYRKALKLSKRSLGMSSVGQMVNLLSNDVNRFDLSVIFFHYLWAGPLQFLIISIITWNIVGPSALIGGLILVAFIPLQTWIGRVFSRLRCKTAGRTDLRIRLMNEIIDGIKVIKMYAWEFPFIKLVNQARHDEISIIKKTAQYRSFNLSFFLSASRLIMSIILCSMILFGEEVNSQKVFLVFGLFNVVRLSLTMFFPNCISFFSEALISVQRIQKFLLLEEISKNSARLNHVIHLPAEEPVEVEMTNVSGIWSQDENEDDIKDISFKVESEELCAIIGPVGSGKSTILQALLGEFPLSDGSINIKGKISYASQESWIFNGTVRKNILMGKPMIEKRYYEVIRVCALEYDIKSWPDKDYTFVGEKGVSLSGGQKARINLARCIYDKADIYLLDDPLSAVDAHVGRHLFDRCIKEFLCDKAVILVTHQLQYLYDADNILLLSPSGAVEDQGSYSKLLKSGKNFSSFMEKEEIEEDTAINGIGSSNVIKSNVIKSNVPEYIRSRLSSVSSFASVQFLDGGVEAPIESFPEEELCKEKFDKKRNDMKESRVKGSVSLKLYMKYFLAGGGLLNFIFVFGFNIFTQSIFIVCDWWIQTWTNAADARKSMTLTADRHYFTEYQNSTSFHIFSGVEVDPFNAMYCSIYMGLIVSVIICSQISVRRFYMSCIKSSKNLHNMMFERVIFAKSVFFDKNPVGRILNRFSKDIGSIDDQMPFALCDTYLIFLNATGIFIIVILTKPEVLAPMAILFIALMLWRRYYLRASTSIKRLEGITRSPVFSHLSASLNGLSTIRASKAGKSLMKEFDDLQDVHTSAFFSFLAITRFFGYFVDWIVVLYISCVVGLFIIYDNDASGGDVGVNLTLSVVLAGMIQWGLRQSAEVENLMTSVERVSEYKNLPLEHNLKSDKELEPSWPNKGFVQFVNVSLKYDKDDPPILKDLNFKTESFEKIGIIGRTGAGKSSMIGALFRLTEPDGEIFIDGENICKLGLHDVRQKISIIPQDPLLFCGSVRKNLDPFDEYEDSEVWDALEQAKLSSVISELKAGLNSEVLDGGANFSIGQRQLVCLARAILRKNKILVMDEATANVDPHTDFLIQEAIRTKFSQCTVFTIAHRLHTVMDSDRIIVLKDGKIEEFGKPHRLLMTKSNLLSQMVEQTGAAMAEKLRGIAKAHYKATKEDVITSNIVVSVEDHDENVVTRL